MISYEILGNPIPLKRHRHRGKICFDPQKEEKNTIHGHIKTLAHDLFPSNTALKLIVEYHMRIPKTYSKKKARECVNTPHFKRPDLSNLVKFTEDVMNGLVFQDDSLISEIQARKFYSHTPRTVVKIEEASKKILLKIQINN